MTESFVHALPWGGRRGRGGLPRQPSRGRLTKWGERRKWKFGTDAYLRCSVAAISITISHTLISRMFHPCCRSLRFRFLDFDKLQRIFRSQYIEKYRILSVRIKSDWDKSLDTFGIIQMKKNSETYLLDVHAKRGAWLCNFVFCQCIHMLKNSQIYSEFCLFFTTQRTFHFYFSNGWKILRCHYFFSFLRYTYHLIGY